MTEWSSYDSPILNPHNGLRNLFYLSCTYSRKHGGKLEFISGIEGIFKLNFPYGMN
jgi:hypothetical protein